MKKFTNDHRAKVTKMMIRRAFTQLLAQQPIQSITIQQLCSCAGINRGTFYSHYHDIYDLLHQLEQEMVEQLSAIIMPSEFSQEDSNPVAICTQIMLYLKENSDMCMIMLGQHGDKQFVASLLSMARGKCIEEYSKRYKNATLKQIEYFYSFVSEGCIGILKQWLAGGMTDSAVEISAMAEGMILGGIGYLAGC